MNRTELVERTAKAIAARDACKHRIGVCCGAACMSTGAEQLLADIRRGVAARGRDADVQVVPTGCMGPCNQGPLVRVSPEDRIYHQAGPAQVEAILDAELSAGTSQADQLIFSGGETPAPERSSAHPFFARQQKIVLKDCGELNPEDLDDYLAHDGYQALMKVLSRMSPEEVIAEIKQSRLRGRGGAGYPTGFKWETVYRSVHDHKFVICNGDEGDPGAFMDRSVLEGNPHRVLEGMAIAAFAVGADKGFAYIRGEYPLAIKRFELALKQARKAGLLGSRVLGTDFSFDVEVRIGAGAFVCGEETALIASIEGKRGTPRPRPPYPAEYGLWGKPTLINNVETLAAVAPIILQGGEWYSHIGTAKSAGTKVFALAGKIRYTGLIEVPMGTTLREIVYTIGGGIQGDGQFKAAQTGGPSGGCIPAQHLDVPMDYDALVALGSIMGSGGLIIMDETSDMVDVARYFMDFCMDESCGKCVPCRVGTRMMHDMLQQLVQGGASRAHLQRLEELAHYVRDTSLCGLGISAPNPLLSTLRHFRKDYESKLTDGVNNPVSGG